MIISIKHMTHLWVAWILCSYIP